MTKQGLELGKFASSDCVNLWTSELSEKVKALEQQLSAAAKREQEVKVQTQYIINVHVDKEWVVVQK